MRKTIYLTLILALTLTGCADKENREKINTFWQQQFTNVLKKKFNMTDAQAKMAVAMTLASIAAQRAGKNGSQAMTQLMQKHAAELQKTDRVYPAQKQNGFQQSAASAPSARPRPVQEETLFELTVDDDTRLFANSPASASDRRVIKQVLDANLESNQRTLQDVQRMFGNQVRNQALVIITRKEKALKKSAGLANSAQAFIDRSNQLNEAAARELNDLYQRNAQNIKRSR